MLHTRGQAALLSPCALRRALALSAAFLLTPNVRALEAPLLHREAAAARWGYFFFFFAAPLSLRACRPAGRRPAALVAPFPALRPVISHLVAFDSHPSERLNEFPVVLGCLEVEVRLGFVGSQRCPTASTRRQIIKVSFDPCGGISSLR